MCEIKAVKQQQRTQQILPGPGERPKGRQRPEDTQCSYTTPWVNNTALYTRNFLRR